MTKLTSGPASSVVAVLEHTPLGDTERGLCENSIGHSFVARRNRALAVEGNTLHRCRRRVNSQSQRTPRPSGFRVSLSSRLRKRTHSPDDRTALPRKRGKSRSNAPARCLHVKFLAAVLTTPRPVRLSRMSLWTHTAPHALMADLKAYHAQRFAKIRNLTPSRNTFILPLQPVRQPDAGVRSAAQTGNATHSPPGDWARTGYNIKTHPR